jgi:HK97 family phage portal protein
VEFWTALVASLLLWGNAFIEKRRLVDGGRLVSLEFLLPHRIRYEKDPRTKRWHYIYNENDGTIRRIEEEDIWHVPAFSVGTKFGLSTIRMGAEVFGAASAAETSAHSIFNNMLSTAGFFEFDKILTKTQRDAFKERITEFVGAPNNGKFMVLEAGMKYNNILMNPDDAQLLQTRKYGVETICRWFRVPPFMVGHAAQGQTNWGTGIESQQIGFLMFTLRPWLVRIEQSANANLLTAADRVDHYFEFTVDGLIRADSKTRSEVQANKVNNGLMTRNEAREADNAPPAEGGDVLTVNAGLMDLASMAKRKDLGEGGSLSSNVQTEALNGAQVTALLDIAKSVTEGTLPPGSARGVIAAAFPLLTTEQIESVIGPLEAFVPKLPPPANQEPFQ